jgi:hypothetical protein
MITMIDQLYDRQYQAGRDALAATILEIAGRLGRAFDNAFAVLNRIEYSAPWAAKARRVRCG